ncbi:hypothetical protein AZE42_10370 [Rhizopogon vesiculosus]|uniref:Uncharacterized protein n=1 Tax=Rhizopogon vesiculosus TaxID=180088 RepID=A0A1J8PSF4_9AGAM|nr:hypothetical protein AZE42_10370 [Rhizopogon vesiculosus]
MTILTRSLDCLDEFLASHPSGVGMGEEDTYCSTLDFQSIPDEHADSSLSQQPTPQRMRPVLGQLLEQECGPLLQESVVVSNAPLRQHSPDLLPAIPGNANYPLNALTSHRCLKGVCARCGQEFQRLYLKRKHELTCCVNTLT